MIIARLAIKSLLNRKTTAVLTIFSIALSVFLLLGVEKLRTGLKRSFLQTVSGVDLVVGPRTSGAQLLLYSVFHMGSPGNNVAMANLRELEKRPDVSWLVPISLGDSHRGYTVVGTTQEYFNHIGSPGRKQLQFRFGGKFSPEGPETVVGSEVSEKLGYSIGSRFTTSHGMGEVSFSEHNQNFKVVGILERTGTPADRSIFISLHSFDALHEEEEEDAHEEEGVDSHEEEGEEHKEYEQGDRHMATAAFVGLKSKIAILDFQRYVNNYPLEPLTAVIPGVAFSEIWRVVSRVETAFLFIAALVGLAAIVGMVVAILASLNERNREMAILRSVGSDPFTIALLLVTEALILAGLGIVFGSACLYLGLWAMQDQIALMAGVYVPIGAPNLNEAIFLGIMFISALIGGIIPAIRAYRVTLTDGLAIRL